MPHKDPEELKEYRRAYMKKYAQKESYKAYRREWMKNWHRKNAKAIYERRRSRPYEKIAATIRSRIYDLLKHGYKSERTENLLGCSMKELKIYLEQKFLPGMSWENYGFYGWHADHVRPLASFDLTKPEEQKKAFHHTNLQPLWAKDNLHKHSKLN